MKTTKQFLELPPINAAHLIGLTLLAFATGFTIATWSNDTIISPAPSYEDIKGYTDSLADTNPAKLAALCGKYAVAAETIKVPVWLTPECDIAECDCTMEREEGYLSGKSAGWKDCETVTDDKGNPKDDIRLERNRKDSREVFESHTVR